MSIYSWSEDKVTCSNFIDINVKKSDEDIRADVILKECRSIRIWGQIRNYDEKPIANALVKLLKVMYCDKKTVYKSVANTMTDSNGFYQFELINENMEENSYRVLVGKNFEKLNYNNTNVMKNPEECEFITEEDYNAVKNTKEAHNRNERIISPYCNY